MPLLEPSEYRYLIIVDLNAARLINGHTIDEVADEYVRPNHGIYIISLNAAAQAAILAHAKEDEYLFALKFAAARPGTHMVQRGDGLPPILLNYVSFAGIRAHISVGFAAYCLYISAD